MNSRFLAYFGTLILMFGVFYLFDKMDVSYESQHPSLNEDAETPDLHLSNVKLYAKDNNIEPSLYHLDQAIASIRSLENDLDVASGEDLELAIEELNGIYNEILTDSLITEDINHGFERVLNTLALAELRISEKYAESNQTALANVALKYAKLHIKNALNYSSDNFRDYERHVYYEIDSLITNRSIPAVILSEKIDHMIEEMDELVHKE